MEEGGADGDIKLGVFRKDHLTLTEIQGLNKASSVRKEAGGLPKEISP